MPGKVQHRETMERGLIEMGLLDVEVPPAVGPRSTTVIPAPAGLTVIDKGGVALPIVALLVDTEGSTTTVKPLYLDEQGQAAPIPSGVGIGLSEAWQPVQRPVQAQPTSKEELSD